MEAKTVRAEAKVLKALQPSPYVVRLVEQGTVSERSFMVMEVHTQPTDSCRPPCCVKIMASCVFVLTISTSG